MKEHTDEQLKLALAKMLPEILMHDNIFNRIHFHEGEYVKWPKVQDTEWLHVCWLVEETLLVIEKASYINELWECCKIQPTGYEWLFTHATWQQRAIALAKVKGTKI